MSQKGIMAANAATVPEGKMVENGGLTFDMDYVQWVNDHQHLINDLRRATNSPMEDNELHIVVEGVTTHYDELFRLKSIGTKADVLHMLFGMWKKTPAERCFIWLGGFRPSELVQILRNELEALTEQQVMELYNLQRSSMMAEDALSHGMEALQNSLSKILSLTLDVESTSSANMVQVKELAMNKLHNLEGFLHAADCLRQQTLRLLQRMLRTPQAARAFLLINDHISQLRHAILIAIEYPRNHCHSMVGNGALAFDTEYERWVNKHQHAINNLRRAFNSQMADNDHELHTAVVAVTSHYDDLFRLKSIGTKADVFHILSGTWKTPVERCFMWLGGFRSSELLKILRNQLEPLTEQQLVGLYNLQQSSLQAEDALSQGMEALHQSLSETLSSTSLGPACSGNVAATLESFLHQADLLRQQTLQQLQKILTIRQGAQALLLISDYISRLRNVKCSGTTSPMIDSKL